MTIAQQIMASIAYRTGEVIYPGSVCKRMGLDQKSVREACIALLNKGLMVREGETGFKKPQKHWIHTSRLCDHEGLTAARVGG